MDIASPSAKILARIDDGIGRITFNNPDKRNAMSMDMWLALAQVLQTLAAQQSLRVLVLQGAGDKAFVSGADISEFEQKRNSQEQRDAYEAAFDEAQDRLANFATPTIAMIQGYCVGGGMALALSCDIRIAGDGARFAIPAARLGVGYGYGSVKSLVAVVGPALAKDILFSARFLEADEALRIGLANLVVPRAELESRVADYAATVAANAPLTIRSIKAAVGEIIADPGQPGPDFVEELVKACFLSADYREGRSAFMEKRKPVFKGS